MCVLELFSEELYLESNKNREHMICDSFVSSQIFVLDWINHYVLGRKANKNCIGKWVGYMKFRKFEMIKAELGVRDGWWEFAFWHRKTVLKFAVSVIRVELTVRLNVCISLVRNVWMDGVDQVVIYCELAIYSLIFTKIQKMRITFGAVQSRYYNFGMRPRFILHINNESRDIIWILNT